MNRFLSKASIGIIFFTWLHIDSKAQQGVTISNDNLDIRFVGKVNSKGSPYLYDSWNKGTVKLEDGTVYKDMDLVFDILYNELIFKGDNGQPLTFEKPVQEFTLKFTFNSSDVTRTFRNGFTTLDGGTPKTFYEVLSDGNIKLLKKLQKKYTDEKETGSLLTTKKLTEITGYYVLNNGKLSRIKKDKKMILSLMNNKAQEVENYISNNKLNVKDEDGLVRIFNYYNRLM